MLLSCASGPQPERALGRVWLDYRALPEQRALAVAGGLRQQRWVAGASGGAQTRVEAEAGALRECAERRIRQRIQDACRLYAVGDEVVWVGP